MTTANEALTPSHDGGAGHPEHHHSPDRPGDHPLAGLHLTGRIVRPSDPDWDAVRMPWNVAIDQRPVAVVLAADAEDVTQAVRHAAHHGLTVTAQPRGHGASSDLADVVLIRTTALDDIWIDAETRVARVGAGVRMGALQAALDGTGLTALSGSSGDVSVVGIALGAGLSWFSRAHGNAAQTLRAVELVDPHGRRRWVTDESDPELMWALRGGGGDFGIVTAAEIGLVPAPELHGGTIAFPIDAAPVVLRAWRDATERATRDTSLWAALLHLPDIPEIPEPMRGQSFALVQAMHLGDSAGLDALLAEVRAAGPVLRDSIHPVAIAEVGTVAEDPEDPSPSMLAATRLTGLTDEAIDALVAVAGGGSGTPILQVQLRHLGGALADPGSPAVAGPEAAPYLMSGLAMVPAPPLAPVMSAGLDAVLDAMAPWATGTAPLTFLDRADTIARSYPDDAVVRLQLLKELVDPAGVVRSNRPVLDAAIGARTPEALVSEI
ncbi:FAD-binding oxidoreductase [Actinotalea sp. M2MS4P-6]|uniref:FAD-binding oxidoreductase n=1 Tax=Actinotalea sp. M2MS4P-6 TaxID=2983762 RepID=UPI0021E3CBC3|nr:FAD-binding oxidoreductase [Actinotalea sp. M2MS4P-6]MCV2393317.1 FAD-binding oxidoreductase [Actinotalea sp. M2MS4P-6]